MLQQDVADSPVVKALAYLYPECFCQDEIFKAHLFTLRSGHPVAKLYAVLAVGLDGLTLGVQHTTNPCLIDDFACMVI